MWKAIFTKFFLILETKRLFHNLFLKRCSKACICGNKSNQTKNRRSYFCLAVLITWCRAAFSQPLIHGVPEVASSKNKPKFYKNLRSNFRKFLLISWSWPLLSQPLCSILLKTYFELSEVLSDELVVLEDSSLEELLVLLELLELLELSEESFSELEDAGSGPLE